MGRKIMEGLKIYDFEVKGVSLLKIICFAPG
jgi:hypothetical protein